MPSAPKTIAIVGGGLVGPLCAAFLAKRGHQVDLFERRADLRKESIAAGRSINLALSTRGLHALSGLGLASKALERAIPMRGRMVHALDGSLSFQPYGKDDSEFINSVSRGELNQVLLSEAERTGHVRTHFKHKALSADLSRGTLEFLDAEDNRVSVRADLIVGADGSASCIRDELLKRTGSACTQETLNYGYKELHIDPAGSGHAFKMERNALHIWPRGSYMLIALPNFDGSFTCTLFLPFEGEASFAALGTPEKVTAFFRTRFADALPLISDLERTFFENPTGKMVTVKSERWCFGEKAFLIGDAAHAIVPFFGQGANCGFEDCVVLDEVLGKEPGFGRALPVFESLRKTNSDAIADLAVENFVEMRDKVGDPGFLLERGVERVLEARFPGEFRSRYAMVTFTRIPYRVAREAGLIQSAILSELCQEIGAPDQVDLCRAERLIRSKLVPYLKERLGGELSWT